MENLKEYIIIYNDYNDDVYFVKKEDNKRFKILQNSYYELKEKNLDSKIKYNKLFELRNNFGINNFIIQNKKFFIKIGDKYKEIIIKEDSSDKTQFSIKTFSYKDDNKNITYDFYNMLIKKIYIC